MIIESSKDTSDTNRAFYGITANGKPYFNNNNYFLNINANSGKREESENFVITVNDDKHSEYLISIAKDTNIELYDLTKGAMLDAQSTSTFINKKNMDSFVQSGINYYDGKNYYLYHSYLTNDFYFIIRKLKFSINKISDVNIEQSSQEEKVVGKIGSCYMNKNNYIICMALMKQSLILSAYASLYVMAYNVELESKYKEKLGNYKIYPNKEGRYTYFIKCIHLMGNKGVFAFYTGINPNLVLNFKEYNQNGGNSELTDFISEVVLEKKSFNTDCLLNDLIKIKDNKICFISTSENNDKMYIVLLIIQ